MIMTAIAACLSLHAECLAKLGTDYPERLPEVPQAIRAKIIRQRDRVSATVEGADSEQHVAQIESLNAGLRLILKKLAPPEPRPAKPPLPVWDDTRKAWKIPDAIPHKAGVKARIEELAEAFNERGPDDPATLFTDVLPERKRKSRIKRPGDFAPDVEILS